MPIALMPITLTPITLTPIAANAATQFGAPSICVLAAAAFAALLVVVLVMIVQIVQALRRCYEMPKTQIQIDPPNSSRL